MLSQTQLHIAVSDLPIESVYDESSHQYQLLLGPEQRRLSGLACDRRCLYSDPKHVLNLQDPCICFCAYQSLALLTCGDQGSSEDFPDCQVSRRTGA